MTSASPIARLALADADLCVKCGACLPACPTYALSRDEGDSPRGRIAQVQGLAIGALRPTPRLVAHLEGCLDCGACEPACPAHVPYRRLIDAGRVLLREAGDRPPRGVRMLVGAATSSPRRMALVAAFALLQRMRMLEPMARLFAGARWAALAAALPRIAARRRVQRDPAPTVELAIGCYAPHLDPDTQRAARAVLTRLGQRAAERTGCCGALARHTGDAAAGDRQVALLAPAAVPLLVSASGCAAELRERHGAQVRELTEFVAASDWPADLALDATPLAVALHVPCTQRRIDGAADAAERLLARLPGVRIVARDGGGCCGAAGTQIVGRPQQADALGDARAAALRAGAPTLVVSSNYGCALHLAARLAACGTPLPVIHPVALMARRLGPEA